MIEKFEVLCQVKRVKEDRLFRDLQAKRKALSEAEEEVVRQQAIVDESKRTLPERENALYDEIIKQVVDIDRIDGTKDKVLGLQKDHEALEDGLNRAVQVKIKFEDQLKKIRHAYQLAQRNREKFENLKTDLEIAHFLQAERKEEEEIEELFAKAQSISP